MTRSLQASIPRPGLARWLDRWPNHCAVCHAPTVGTAARVCADCSERFAPRVARCGRCALRVPARAPVCGACLRRPPPWSSAIAACDYGYPWDGLLTSLKFHAALDLVPALAGLLERHLVPEAATVDLVLPVPLGDRRLRERGYNQAGLLARRLGHRLRLASSPEALLRVNETPPQTALHRDRRAANVLGAFALAPRVALQGRRIALVDDVMTTGATLGELARLVLDAGAADVKVWVVARTPA